MNNKCDNINCIYHKTCLIDNYKREKKCSLYFCFKNTAHPKEQAITRGNDEKKE